MVLNFILPCFIANTYITLQSSDTHTYMDVCSHTHTLVYDWNLNILWSNIYSYDIFIFSSLVYIHLFLCLYKNCTSRGTAQNELSEAQEGEEEFMLGRQPASGERECQSPSRLKRVSPWRNSLAWTVRTWILWEVQPCGRGNSAWGVRV